MKIILKTTLSLVTTVLSAAGAQTISFPAAVELTETLQLPECHSIGWVQAWVKSDLHGLGKGWDGVLDEAKWGRPSPQQLVSRNWDWKITDEQWREAVKQKGEGQREDVKFDLWVPERVDVVKGIVVISGHGSGEGLFRRPDLRTLTRELHLALFKFIGNPVQRGFWPRSLLFERLKAFGAKCGHPELEHAPLFLYGHSNGTGFSAVFPAYEPQRVWGWVSMRPGITFQVYQPDAAQVPGLVIFGEDDHFLARPSKEENLAVVPLMRKKHNALWNFAVEPKTGHGPGEKTWPLVFSFLRHTFAARVPPDADPRQGPVKLNALSVESGYLGQNWDPAEGGYQELPIASFTSFTRDKATASWLVNAAYAADWQAFQRDGEVKNPGVGQKQARVPQSLDELWADFPRLERDTPLDAETLKAWNEGDVVCRVVRFQIGIFKGASSRVAAFYAFPRGGAKLPALLQLHGGGQSASLDAVLTDARRGYAALSLNWGGNPLNFGRSTMVYDGPQTDWGKLDATHPPQRNKANHFAGPLAPDEFTLDIVESPRNSNWFLVLLAARRAVTFLEQQPEVDPERLGVYGHSMGGKLTTDLAGIEPRIKAAVPSCGGAGDILESQTDLPGCVRKSPTALELACVSDNAYIPRITCPILWLSPTNDFHAAIGNMAWNWRNLPDDRTRFSIAPHLNHRHTDEHHITQHLWFEQHLKNAFQMPRSPQLALNLQAGDGIPAITVTPDDSQGAKRVDVHYSTDPHERTRFWRTVPAVSDGKAWRANCPVMSLDQPLFAFANVLYELPDRYRDIPVPAGSRPTDMFAVSSRVHWVRAAELRSAGVQATARRERVIDDGNHGWRDWYRLNWDHPPLWQAVTRKVKDPQWRGPDDAKLVFEMKPAADCTLVIKVSTNGWGAFEEVQPAVDHAAEKQLRGGSDWQTVTVSLGDFTPPLANWRTVTELTLTPAREVAEGRRKRPIAGTPWQGPRDIRNLRWEGGEDAKNEE